MTRSRALLALLVCVLLGAYASSASAATTFQPRVKNALGLIPPVNSQGNFNTVPSELGVFNAVTYHGGPTMSGGVNVHVIFWAPPGFAFQGSPGAGIPTYQGMIEQYYTDVAASSTGTAAGPGCSTSACNDFTVEPQYGHGTTVGGITSGANTINFHNTSQAFSGSQTLNPADSVILDSSPYPTAGNGPGQCSSPQDTTACILDTALQAEVDNIVQHTTGTPRGLHNLWYVFLPPNVDECISQNVCGTNAFGGYHSLSNVNGHGLTIYALTIDPIIEAGSVSPGADPQGNPDAEVVVDIADHETNEAMTDPTGVGWIDPNAFEVGDKCEFGPQRGTPLGFSNGSPYNQVINGHKYLTQEIWSQADGGCVQASSMTIANSGLPLPQVSLTQFSPNVSGNIGSATSGIPVEVRLLRGASGDVVADSTTTTDSNGNWSLTLQHAVGDDRDVIEVIYNNGSTGTGVPAQPTQVILTGNGGNPFIEGGWMGWSDMDNGANVAANTLTLNPCFQTGVFASSVTTGSPTNFCSTSLDSAAAPTNTTVTSGTAVTWSSMDNRAAQPGDTQFPNAAGGLVTLTVPAGEPGSTSVQGSFFPPFSPTGFPACSADLGAQMVTCSGLNDGNVYSITDGSRTVSGLSSTGGVLSAPLTLHRDDVVSLSNGTRVLTTLHVANLQVHINGASGSTSGGSVASGTCSADQYWGGPLVGPVLSAAAGELGGGGPAGTGQICVDGNPAGLPTSTIAQTDDQSGGQTVTEVADLANTSPIEGETLYGRFTALAEATDGVSPIGLTISHNGTNVFSSDNVDTADGVPVRALSPGNYTATWTVTNPNGDTRTVTTRFIEQSALQGQQGQQGQQGPRGRRGPAAGPTPTITCTTKHSKITCAVIFRTARQTRGMIRMMVARGGRIAALGHGAVRHGHARITMRERRRIRRGRWTATIVLARAHKAPATMIVRLRMK